MKKGIISPGKTLFSTAALIVMLALTTLAGPGSISARAAGYQFIGEEKANSIAFKDAGVSADSVYVLKCVLDIDDDDYEAEYEIEFYSGDYEYEYNIDAYSGYITERDRERAKYSAPVSPSSSKKPAATGAVKKNTALKKTESARPASKAAASKTAASNNAIKKSTSAATVKFITAAKAKKIALKNAGFKARNVKSFKSKLDKEDAEYEIKFEKGNYRYEYTINAVSGKIKNRSYEAIKVSRARTGKAISKKKAKNIALKKAKVKKVSKCTIKSDTFKGARVWEVSFKKGKAEYELKISKYKGKVLDFEYDIED